MNRKLTEVIDKLLKVIPETETSLRASLEKVKMSYQFRAPEIERLSWNEAHAALAENIGERQEPWTQQVIKIWTNTE